MAGQTEHCSNFGKSKFVEICSEAGKAQALPEPLCDISAIYEDTAACCDRPAPNFRVLHWT